MKKLMTLVCAFLLCAPLTAAAADVEINTENFPDENFRGYLLEQGYGKDGVLKESILQSLGGLVISNKNIRDLKGIEFFVSLTHLDCSDNQLTTLDLSDNTKLVTLFCNDNALTTLNIAECKALTTIRCYHNQIKGESMEALISSLPQNPTNSQYAIYIYDNVTSGEGNVCTTAQVSAAKVKGWLPVSYNGTGWSAYEGSNDDVTVGPNDIAITEANFPDVNFRRYLTEQDYGKDGILTEEEINGIINISVSGKNISTLKGIEFFTALDTLNCMSNQLTSLDISNNTALTTLSCAFNQLTTLDVSSNTALTYLECAENQLTTLYVSDKIEYLGCSRNQFTVLDISKCTALIALDCCNNFLTELNASNNTALEILYCYNNQLTTLDISKNTKLGQLLCYNNQLTELDLSNNSALAAIQCQNNLLTALKVSENAPLSVFRCCCNQIKGEAMDIFISSLPQMGEDHRLLLYDDEASDEGNVITKSQVAAAKAKDWTPYYTTDGKNWYEYEGSDDAATSLTQPELGVENSVAPIYTLSGQKVKTASKGIYIIGGKKMVVK